MGELSTKIFPCLLSPGFLCRGWCKILFIWKFQLLCLCWSNCCIHGNWRANSRQLPSSLLKCYWSLSVQNFMGQLPVCRLGYWRFSEWLSQRHGECSKVVFVSCPPVDCYWTDWKFELKALNTQCCNLWNSWMEQGAERRDCSHRRSQWQPQGKANMGNTGELFIIHSDTNGNFTIGVAESSIPHFKWMCLKILSKNRPLPIFNKSSLVVL